MNKYLGWALKGLALAGLAVICAGIGLVYADTDTHIEGIEPMTPPNWGPSDDLEESATSFVGWEPNQVVLVPSNEPTLEYPFVVAAPSVAGVATGEIHYPRAEILATKIGDAGNAWMKSSGGARVQEHCGGDVVITLGD